MYDSLFVERVYRVEQLLSDTGYFRLYEALTLSHEFFQVTSTNILSHYIEVVVVFEQEKDFCHFRMIKILECLILLLL